MASANGKKPAPKQNKRKANNQEATKRGADEQIDKRSPRKISDQWGVWWPEITGEECGLSAPVGRCDHGGYSRRKRGELAALVVSDTPWWLAMFFRRVARRRLAKTNSSKIRAPAPALHNVGYIRRAKTPRLSGVAIGVCRGWERNSSSATRANHVRSSVYCKRLTDEWPAWSHRSTLAVVDDMSSINPRRPPQSSVSLCQNHPGSFSNAPSLLSSRNSPIPAPSSRSQGCAPFLPETSEYQLTQRISLTRLYCQLAASWLWFGPTTHKKIIAVFKMFHFIA